MLMKTVGGNVVSAEGTQAQVAGAEVVLLLLQELSSRLWWARQAAPQPALQLSSFPVKVLDL